MRINRSNKQDACTCKTFEHDVELTAGHIRAEVEEVLLAGRCVTFAGSSNGGHIATHFASLFDPKFLILISTTPLSHQEDALILSRVPVVMTIGSHESFFGGSLGLRTIARHIGAWRVDFEGYHCRETHAVIAEAVCATQQWFDV